jgi:hypothetical protein
MTLLLALIVVATALNGLLGGLSFEMAVVKLPTRRRIGAVAYATFARGSDLGNGLWFYPLMAISAALVRLVATVVAYVERQPTTLLVSLTLAPCSASVTSWSRRGPRLSCCALARHPMTRPCWRPYSTASPGGIPCGQRCRC